MGTCPRAQWLRSPTADEINAAIRKLDPADVSHVAFTIGEDHTGDPALYFRVVLTDAASSIDRLSDVAERVSKALMEALHPLENWGLLPYFSFRSYSERQQLNDPVLAPDGTARGTAPARQRAGRTAKRDPGRSATRRFRGLLLGLSSAHLRGLRQIGIVPTHDRSSAGCSNMA
jgi:hypothetical protein